MQTRIAAPLVLALLFGGCPRTPDDTGDTEDADTDTDTDSDTDTDTDADTDTDTEPAVSCHEQHEDLSAWAGPPPEMTETPYTETNTGLAAVVAAGRPLAEDGATTVNLQVTGVHIAARGFTPEGGEVWNVWLADAEAAAKTDFRDSDIALTLEQTEPGSIVSFRVTEVSKFGQEIQISDADGWTVTSTEPAPVYVQESTGAAITIATGDAIGTAADDRYWMHHIYGELTDGPTSCGGESECFTLTHGAEGTETVEFRLNNDNLSTPFVAGDCVEVVAPMGAFSGPQFNLDNFDWFRWYGDTN